jgi:hypothetical protein
MALALAACTGTQPDSDRPGADHSAGPTPTSPPSSTSTTAPALSTVAVPPRVAKIRLNNLPVGSPPKVEYLDGTVMVRRDGVRVPLQNQDVPPEYAHEAPGRHYFGFARFSGGWLTATDSMGAILQIHRLDGSLAKGWLGNGMVAASSPDQTRAIGTRVLIEPDGRVVRFRGNPVGFLGDDIVVNRGRSVFLGTPNHGFTLLPRIKSVSSTASSGTLVIGALQGHDRDVVYDTRTGQPILSAPSVKSEYQYQLRSLSPDGSYVVAAHSDGWPVVTTMVLARTESGEPVASLRLIPSHGEDPMLYWENARHLLMSTGDHIVRIGVDGSAERAGGHPRHHYLLPTSSGWDG